MKSVTNKYKDHHCSDQRQFDLQEEKKVELLPIAMHSFSINESGIANQFLSVCYNVIVPTLSFRETKISKISQHLKEN